MIISPKDLYSSDFSINFMVESQELLFRYSPDLDTSNSRKELVVQPLNRGAKKRIYNKNHKK